MHTLIQAVGLGFVFGAITGLYIGLIIGRR